MDERDLVTVLPEFFDETRAMHLMASDIPVDIISIGSGGVIACVRCYSVAITIVCLFVQNRALIKNNLISYRYSGYCTGESSELDPTGGLTFLASLRLGGSNLKCRP